MVRQARRSLLECAHEYPNFSVLFVSLVAFWSLFGPWVRWQPQVPRHYRQIQLCNAALWRVIAGPGLSTFAFACAISLSSAAPAVLSDEEAFRTRRHGEEGGIRISGWTKRLGVRHCSGSMYDCFDFNVPRDRETSVRQRFFGSSVSKWKPSLSVMRCLRSNHQSSPTWTHIYIGS